MAVVAGAVVWQRMRSLGPSDTYTTVVVLWVVSCLSVVVAGWSTSALSSSVSTAARVERSSLGQRGSRWVSAHRVDLLIGTALVVAAAALRLWRLDAYPVVFNGDEGSFAHMSRAVLAGDVRNPFAVGWFSHPNLYFFAEAASLRWIGNDVAGTRIPSALIGAGTIGVVFAFARIRFGRGVAVVAAVVLATFPLHLFVSRLGLNNATDALFTIAVVAFSEAALHRRSIGLAVAAGFTLGLAQYGFFGARILPVVVVVLAGLEWLRRRHDGADTTRHGLLTIVAWLGVATTAVALPLLAYTTQHFADVTARSRQVSIFGPFADGSFSNVRHKLWNALLMPVAVPVEGFYRVGAPFVGWVLAVPVVVGLALATWRFRRLGYGAVAVTYWIVLVAAALTDGQRMYSNRVVGTLPLLAIAGGIGVVAMGRALTTVTRLPITVPLATGVAVAAAWVGLAVYFSAPNRFEVYSDGNTEIAFGVASDVAERSPTETVYFLGSARMRLDGFASVGFLIPDADVQSVLDPLGDDWVPPQLHGPTTFVFLPERAPELAEVQEAFPDGQLVAADDPWTGGALYIEWRVPWTPNRTCPGPVACWRYGE